VDDALRKQLQEDAEVDYQQALEDDAAIQERVTTQPDVCSDMGSGVLPEEPIQDWIFTFGYDHVNPITGETLFKRFVKLRGTYVGARMEMVRRFGRRFAFQYPLDEAGRSTGIIMKFKLTELELQNTTSRTYR